MVFFVIYIFNLTASYLLADGFVIPNPRPGEKIPPLTVKYNRVKVEIINQVAKTSIDQVFINNHTRDIEWIFIFPLPEKEVISEFSMYIGNNERILNKNLVFVIDSSGSMNGKKMIQAKDAVRFIISQLDEKDKFSLVDFDFGVDVFSSEIVFASAENKEKALRSVDEIEGAGGTNINEALVQTLGMMIKK